MWKSPESLGPVQWIVYVAACTWAAATPQLNAGMADALAPLTEAVKGGSAAPYVLVWGLAVTVTWIGSMITCVQVVVLPAPPASVAFAVTHRLCPVAL